VADKEYLNRVDLKAQELAKRIHAFRRALAESNRSIKEEQAPYDIDEI
jgi:hypothetical protein